MADALWIPRCICVTDGKDDDDGESATRKGFFLARRSESKSRREKSPVWAGPA